MPVSPFRLLNALYPIIVVSWGMTVFLPPTINVLLAVSMIALQLFLLSYTGLSELTVISERLLQELNALTSILVTLAGMIILSRLVQPENVSSSIAVI